MTDKGPKRRGRKQGGKKAGSKSRHGDKSEAIKDRGFKSSGETKQSEVDKFGKPKSKMAHGHDQIKINQIKLDEAAKATMELLAKMRLESRELAESNERKDDSVEPQLDPWQSQVLEALVEGKSVVVDAPTTAGKTRAVEFFFRLNIKKKDFRAAYTAPVKSLSNDKLREFSEMFGAENIGIATGDIKENLGAPIVVTTLETYRNSLLGVEPDLGRHLVIFDEYHFMQDYSRGSAWEEALVLTPPDCQLLLLSASVGNAEEFAEWLNKIHERETVLIRTTVRPVPLRDLIYLRGRWLDSDTLGEAVFKRLPIPRDLKPLPANVIAPRIASARALGLTPTIVYAGKRLSCEIIAGEVAKVAQPLEGKRRDAVAAALKAMKVDLRLDQYGDDFLLQTLADKGVAYHHSGLAPNMRRAVESLLKDGLIDFCVATMGLSIGINFSVRSALIADLERPGELGPVLYSRSETLQMLGRAGRRGKDPVGLSLWPSIESFKKLGGEKPRDSCVSQLRKDPTTFLGLVSRGFTLDQLESFYSRSFLRFQKPHTDLRVLRKESLAGFLNVTPDKMPCFSPVSEWVEFRQKSPSKCRNCPYRKPCHNQIERRMSGDLVALQAHLHGIGCLDELGSLTNFGNFARFFPQNGGLFIAQLLSDGLITAETLPVACELMACLMTARHKTPEVSHSFQVGFDLRETEDALVALYPESLFPEYYDPPYGRRSYSQIREFCPEAGYPIKLWLEGVSWNDLESACTGKKYGSGDLTSLIYRVATYLQSVVQTRDPILGPAAAKLRDKMLREPLTVQV